MIKYGRKPLVRTECCQIGKGIESTDYLSTKLIHIAIFSVPIQHSLTVTIACEAKHHHLWIHKVLTGKGQVVPRLCPYLGQNAYDFIFVSINSA